MLKKSIYILIFVIVSITIAIVIKPSDDELLYVYEKAEKREKLKDKYEFLRKNNPKNIELQEKQLKNLEILDDEKYIEHLIDFYEKTKNKKDLTRILNYYKIKKDYIKLMNWYEKAYKEFNDNNSLNEIIKLASFIKNKEKQIIYIKEAYSKNKNKTLLFNLYNLNEKKFSLKKLRQLALENKLTKEEYTKTLQLSIYSNDLKEAFTLFKRKNLDYIKGVENFELFEYFLKNTDKKDELKKLYRHMNKSTNEEKYFNALINMYSNEININKSIEAYKEKYKETKSLDYLENIIYLNYINENQKEYLYYLSIKALNTKDIKVLKYVITEYFDLDDISSVKILLEKIEKLTPAYDEFKELYLLTLVYLEEKDKAEAKFLEYKPKNPSTDIIYSIFEKKINEKSMPYFMTILKDSTDEETKSKLFRYRYKTLRLFTPETYKVFGQANTYKKLSRYMFNFSKEDKNKNYKKFANNSTDPMFLADIGFYFLSINDYDTSNMILTKAYNINPRNLFVLDYLSQLKTSTNDYDESLKLMKSYLTIKANPIINFRIAEVLYATNKKTIALKHYKIALNKIKNSSVENKSMLLKSKARLITNFNELKIAYENLIIESNYSEYIILEYLNLSLENKQYAEVLSLLEKYKNKIKIKKDFKNLEVNSLINLNKYQEAKIAIESFIKTNSSEVDISMLEQLGFVNLYLKDRKATIIAFDKSIEKGSTNQELITLNNELKKNYRNNISIKAGLRSEIKETQIKATYSDNLYKVSILNDTYDEYSSAKFFYEDIEDKYSFGLGQDYIKIGFDNISNSNINLLFQQNVDINVKQTIKDELKYENYQISYGNDINKKYFYTLKFDYFKYNKFNRKRFDTSIYNQFSKNYFATLSYIYEEVKGENTIDYTQYGYSKINSPSISFGRNYNINNKLSYLSSLGIEIKDYNINALSNFNLTYKNRDLNIDWENNFFRDDFINKYNFSSLLYIRYFYN